MGCPTDLIQMSIVTANDERVDVWVPMATAAQLWGCGETALDAARARVVALESRVQELAEQLRDLTDDEEW